MDTGLGPKQPPEEHCATLAAIATWVGLQPRLHKPSLLFYQVSCFRSRGDGARQVMSMGSLPHFIPVYWSLEKWTMMVDKGLCESADGG